jgi:endonuclease/exonuclease/phosphatase family metal-dependent hydrolase
MKEKLSIGFYNLENFFDTVDDPKTQDNPFTPKGFMHWISKRYFNKAKKIAYVISRLGYAETQKLPALVGLGEVENKTVLNDLIKSKYLRKHDLGFVHFESEDRRGMDVALLYDKMQFELLESRAHPLTLYTNKGLPYKTRDILYCRGLLKGEAIHLLINHWPSRREGDIQSGHKRRLASEQLREIINYIQYEEDDAKIIVMGDFNTDPDDETIKTELVYKDFFNPSEALFKQHLGSLNHQQKWHLFDQLIFSNYFNSASKLQYKEMKIFAPKYLKTWHGKLKNKPFRTYIGSSYQGGYSDHFPVYAILEYLK